MFLVVKLPWQFPLMGVVTHEIPVHLLNLDDKEKAIQLLQEGNRNATSNINIKRVGWSPKLKPAQQSGSLIVELDSAGTANQQIDGGIAMGYRVYDCQYFNPKCLMKQYFSCSRYGHIPLSCSDEKVCGACSSKTHCSSQCPREIVLLCPLCKGAHVA